MQIYFIHEHISLETCIFEEEGFEESITIEQW